MEETCPGRMACCGHIQAKGADPADLFERKMHVTGSKVEAIPVSVEG